MAQVPTIPTPAAAVFPPLGDRPVKNTIVLFDVDGTLTPARRSVSPEMLELLTRLRHRVAIAFVGGSDLKKQEEQLGASLPPGADGKRGSVVDMFDYAFAENGLTAYRLGQELPSQSFIKHLGEDKYRKLARFCLRYITERCMGDEGADSIPVVRGTFIEFRNGMINVSPIGRNASIEERIAFEKFDLEHGVRKRFVEALRKEFPDYNLTFSIGGQISFDVFPAGWDKTYCLRHLEAESEREDKLQFDNIHFFGDKTFEGGNDHEIFADKRTIGHTVKNPEDTMAQLKELFFKGEN